MKAMATAEACRSACGFMEESLPCDSGAVAVRRRRMEIRRFKMVSNANAFVELPVSKRLRPDSGIPYTPREDGDGSIAFCVTDRDNAVCDTTGSIERRQENSASRLSVCEMAREPGDAASSLSTAWERPSGGESLECSEEDECADNVRGRISSGSARMSSDSGSSSGGGHVSEELNEASTLTFAEGSQSSANGEEVGGVEAIMTSIPVVPNSSSTVEMAAPSSTDILTEGETTSVGTEQVEETGELPNYASSWQEPAAESSLVNSTVAEGAGGSSMPNHCMGSNECPPHGMMSLCGRRREMEDAVVAQPTFMMLPCDVAGGCVYGGSNANAGSSLHFFGVYDGHGGSQAANFCKDRLHQALAEQVQNSFGREGEAHVSSDWEAQWQKAMSSCFLRMDAEVGGLRWKDCDCGQPEGCPRCTSEPIAPETVGSTAIVAVVGSCQIIIGNCGDSRAVLSRGGVAVPLSVDHKPEREDEMARVEAAGGRVIYWNGYRVLGVLAMSRAIGDRYLKPYVIAEPEVKCIKRSEDDECLILASDGLWDVMSNEVVCDIARRALNCRGGSRPPVDGETRESPAAQAAALLTKLALSKGSSDNISVVVVDLKVPQSR